MCGPLPPSIKAPTHWLSVVDVSIWTAVCPHKPLVASTQDKAEFPFYKSCLSIGFWAVSSQTPPSVTILLGEGNTSHQSLGAQTYSWVERGVRQTLESDRSRLKTKFQGTSLVAQWLRLYAPNAGCLGLIPDQGTKIPHAATKTWYSQKNLLNK